MTCKIVTVDLDNEDDSAGTRDITQLKEIVINRNVDNHLCFLAGVLHLLGPLRPRLVIIITVCPLLRSAPLSYLLPDRLPCFEQR